MVSRKGRVVLADYVSGEEGSGLVHTAPGHGNEDYLIGIKYKLAMKTINNSIKFINVKI
jgi:isoleucyl-tRNA synthetase